MPYKNFLSSCVVIIPPAFSNTACETPQLNGPSGLSVQGTGSFLTLAWNPPESNDQDGFNIYRDGEQHAYTTDTIFEDHDTEVAVEYCYTAKAVYDGIGESPSSNESCAEWLIFPPSEVMIEDGDGYIIIEEFEKTLKIMLHYKKYSTNAQ